MVDRLMTRRCAVCGDEGADILCAKCKRFVCERCYDEDADSCIKCSGSSRARRGAPVRSFLLVAGFGLIMLGLMLVAYAVTPSNSTIVVFPFFMFGARGTAAFVLGMAFFLFFMASTLLPVYLALRRGGPAGWDEEIYTMHEGPPLSSFYETIEYMITTEVPQGLEGSIYIEEDEGRLRLLSSRDNGFIRVYDVPSNCLVDDVESDYEGSYLLLRVRLRKLH
jgi:hypothetical protein